MFLKKESMMFEAKEQLSSSSFFLMKIYKSVILH